MGSGKSGLYSGTTPDSSKPSGEKNSGPVNHKDYNTAGSSSVKQVDAVSSTSELHSIPTHGRPNSVSKNYKDGKLDSERYYDSSGKAYLDIDYTNHGNSKMHPDVPHEHSIYFDENGGMHRNDPPEGGIKK